MVKNYEKNKFVIDQNPAGTSPHLYGMCSLTFFSYFQSSFSWKTDRFGLFKEIIKHPSVYGSAIGNSRRVNTFLSKRISIEDQKEI